MWASTRVYSLGYTLYVSHAASGPGSARLAAAASACDAAGINAFSLLRCACDLGIKNNTVCLQCVRLRYERPGIDAAGAAAVDVWRSSGRGAGEGQAKHTGSQL